MPVTAHKVILATILLIVGTGCFFSCEKVIDLEINSNPHLLVVNGVITDGEGPYNISLRQTMTYSFNDPSEEVKPVSGALVHIIDDLGNSAALTEWSPGNYQTDPENFRGAIGRVYHVDIVTPEGKHYISKPERLHPVPEIERVYFKHYANRPDYYSVFIDYQDPAGESNCYRWRFFVNNMSQLDIDVEDDRFYDGKKVLGRHIGGWSQPLDSLHAVVQQLSLTREALDYWSMANEQFEQQDNAPYDTPPAPLFGNIYNADRPDEYALGFFGASAIRVKTIIIY